MIIVHETFVCKPGNASKLAKLFKDAFSYDPHIKQVMTDMTGQYNRVIMAAEYQNLAEYGKSWEDMKNPTPEMKEAMKKMEGYTELYLTGSREIFRVW